MGDSGILSELRTLALYWYNSGIYFGFCYGLTNQKTFHKLFQQAIRVGTEMTPDEKNPVTFSLEVVSSVYPGKLKLVTPSATKNCEQNLKEV